MALVEMSILSDNNNNLGRTKAHQSLPVVFVSLFSYEFFAIYLFFRKIKPSHVSKEFSSLVLDPVTNRPIPTSARHLQSQRQANAYVPEKPEHNNPV